MQAQGFHSSRLGTVALVALGCFYAQWLGLYLVVLVDYYWECELTGLNNMCFYGSYPIFGNYNRNSTVLFGTWLCSLAAYSHLLVYSARLRNFYRLPCAVEAAQPAERRRLGGSMSLESSRLSTQPTSAPRSSSRCRSSSQWRANACTAASAAVAGSSAREP